LMMSLVQPIFWTRLPLKMIVERNPCAIHFELAALQDYRRGARGKIDTE
jgi:hypothetical protein